MKTAKTLKNRQGEVLLADPYNYRDMSSLGNAKYMLVKQFKFPLTFDQEKDQFNTAYLDRIQSWWPKDTEVCLKKFNLPQMGLEHQIRNMEDNKILDFLCEIMKAEREKYTGYRILCGVGGSGYPYYSFQLFSKHPDTDTEVFSGEHAPNVRMKTL